jgi:hypothetical protein
MSGYDQQFLRRHITEIFKEYFLRFLGNKKEFQSFKPSFLLKVKYIIFKEIFFNFVSDL